MSELKGGGGRWLGWRSYALSQKGGQCPRSTPGSRDLKGTQGVPSQPNSFPVFRGQAVPDNMTSFYLFFLYTWKMSHLELSL